MPSPFPGMNPYLEHPRVWQDFHDTYIPALRAVLNPQVIPAGYFVRIDENVAIRDSWREDEEPVGKPDVVVPRVREGGRKRPVVAAVSAPVTAELPRRIDTDRLPYLEVIDRNNDQVVTVIELLSPSNKEPGDDRATFLAKRRKLLSADVNYVEIDLLRRWKRLPLRKCPASDYAVMVSRPAERPKVQVWPVELRHRLPVTPIPLRPGESEPTVDLQAVLHHVYDEVGYQHDVYRREPDPPLSADEAAWAKELLVAAGMTPAG
jgi:hypothetical protein